MSAFVTLYPFQRDAVDQIEREIAEERSKLLLVAPTGAGKTVIAAAIIARAVERHHRVVVLSHRREIITQTRDKLIANGLNPGVIQAGLEKDLRLQAPVQVASIQTLWARAMRSKVMPLPAGTLIIIDEAHHSRASTYQKIIDAYPDAILLGLTATPCRGDGRGLGNVFKMMIECPQVAELITGGYPASMRRSIPISEACGRNKATT